MYINTFKYTPKDVSCQLCTEYVKKLGCTTLRCPWLAERIEAGVVGYREAVMETFPRDRRLSSRLNLLIKHLSLIHIFDDAADIGAAQFLDAGLLTHVVDEVLVDLPERLMAALTT